MKCKQVITGFGKTQEEGSEFGPVCFSERQGIFSLPLFSSSLQEINIFKGQTCGFIFHLDSFRNADKFCIRLASFSLFWGEFHFISQAPVCRPKNASEMSLQEMRIWLTHEALLSGQLMCLLLACERGLWVKRQDSPGRRANLCAERGQIVALVAAGGNRIYRIRTCVQ